jgi:isopenicillin N synthase-like dioxygenase
VGLLVTALKEESDFNKVDYDCHEAFLINALDDTLLPNKDDSPKFGQSFVEMSGLFEKLVRRILMALALALGKDSDYLLKMYKEPFTDKNFTTLKTLFYPAIPENEFSENTRSTMAKYKFEI